MSINECVDIRVAIRKNKENEKKKSKKTKKIIDREETKRKCCDLFTIHGSVMCLLALWTTSCPLNSQTSWC